MSELQELVESADRFCRNLQVAADNEKKFCIDLCYELERYSNQIGKMKSELEALNQYWG